MAPRRLEFENSLKPGLLVHDRPIEQYAAANGRTYQQRREYATGAPAERAAAVKIGCDAYGKEQGKKEKSAEQGGAEHEACGLQEFAA